MPSISRTDIFPMYSGIPLRICVIHCVSHLQHQTSIGCTVLFLSFRDSKSYRPKRSKVAQMNVHVCSHLVHNANSGVWNHRNWTLFPVEPFVSSWARGHVIRFQKTWEACQQNMQTWILVVKCFPTQRTCTSKSNKVPWVSVSRDSFWNYIAILY